jgi:ubiquinone/menaquinone biosynthesis C-methylase UbiE
MAARSAGTIFLGGLATAALLAAWRIYSRRSRERLVSHEGLDNPEVARAFNWVATMPQMRLLCWFVARRAVAMVQTGAAADLGCGPGHLVTKLARIAPGLQVTGIDLSDEMLREAERVARRSGLRDRTGFKRGDAAQIPFPDGSLDLVVSTLSLHHWSDPVAVLDEVARVLRPPKLTMGQSLTKGQPPAKGQPGGSFLILDLRRDMALPFYLLLWLATRLVVPRALRRVNEPLGSRNAAFTPREVAHLVGQSGLTGWRVTRGPLWLTLEGTLA